MNITEEITSNNVPEIAQKFLALSNEKHLKMLLFVENNPELPLDKIHHYCKTMKLYLTRQSTHKALEKLFHGGYLIKSYNKDKGRIVYTVK